MRHRTYLKTFGTTLTLVEAGSTRANPWHVNLLPSATILAASLVVCLLGIQVLPTVLGTGDQSPGPVQNSIVVVGNLHCGVGSEAAGCSDHQIARLVDALAPALVLPLDGTAFPGRRGVAPNETAQSAPEFPFAATAVARYYSYDYADWHFIALNGDCADVGGCGPGSAQERWLAADLAQSRAKCTLAYWQQPRFSSGPHGGDPAYDAFWRHLYAAGAELVINGHEPGYERFARQSPDAELDVRQGLREFVVGTGSLDPEGFSGAPSPRSVVRNAAVPGVLQLVLHPDSYRWQFVPVFGQRFKDTGAGTCH